MSMSYGKFAYMYDKLMHDVNYNEWVDYIEKIFKRFNKKPKLVLELGCGTGSVCTKMAQKGYDMIGLDLSSDMLSVAMNKSKQLNQDVLYINQDMTEFELYGTVDAVICMLDSINYVTDKKDLLKTLKLVKNYLNPGGLFIFDINSKYKFKNILDNNTFAVDEGDIFYVWENDYDEISEICEFYLTFFVKQEKGYKKINEVHRERAYDVLMLKECINSVGLNIKGIYDEFSFCQPAFNSSRIFFVVEK